MLSKKNNKTRKQTRKQTRKNIKKMKGGAEEISGFVKIVSFLYKFNDKVTTDKSAPNILEFVDWHGNEKSILARFINKNYRNVYLTMNRDGNNKANNGETENFYDIDKFRDSVVKTLSNVEKQIALGTNSEFKCLSMKNRGYEGVYPYYLLVKSSPNDNAIIR